MDTLSRILESGSLLSLRAEHCKEVLRAARRARAVGSRKKFKCDFEKIDNLQEITCPCKRILLAAKFINPQELMKEKQRRAPDSKSNSRKKRKEIPVMQPIFESTRILLDFYSHEKLWKANMFFSLNFRLTSPQIEGDNLQSTVGKSYPIMALLKSTMSDVHVVGRFLAQYLTSGSEPNISREILALIPYIGITDMDDFSDFILRPLFQWNCNNNHTKSRLTALEVIKRLIINWMLKFQSFEKKRPLEKDIVNNIKGLIEYFFNLVELNFFWLTENSPSLFSIERAFYFSAILGMFEEIIYTYPETWKDDFPIQIPKCLLYFFFLETNLSYMDRLVQLDGNNMRVTMPPKGFLEENWCWDSDKKGITHCKRCHHDNHTSTEIHRTMSFLSLLMKSDWRTEKLQSICGQDFMGIDQILAKQ